MSPFGDQQTLTLGVESPIVQEVADRLYRIGHLPQRRPVSHVFDEELAEAVRHFQQQRGLIVDGTVDEETYRLLEEARWALGDRTLYHTSGKLMAGEDVTLLQLKLAELGFQPGRIDGLFGVNTANAVREFQKSVGLPIDGVCGATVFKALSQLSRTVAGGNPYLLRAQLSQEHFSGVQTRSIVLDTNDSAGDLLCADLIIRTEGRLSALGSSVSTTFGLKSIDETTKASFVNNIGADIYINVSRTSFKSSKAQGCASYYFAGGGGWSSVRGRRLAELIQEEITSLTELIDGRVHGKSWDLLRQTQMPAVQVEVAYLSNETDAALLESEMVRDQISLGLTNAIVRFFQPSRTDD